LDEWEEEVKEVDVSNGVDVEGFKKVFF